MRLFALALATVTSLILSQGARAVTLGDGDTLDQLAYLDFGEIDTSDPYWIGSFVGSSTSVANRQQDGFANGIVVDNLYDVGALVEVFVYQNALDFMVFEYKFTGFDRGLEAPDNGIYGFSFGGFAGLFVEVGWADAPNDEPEVPVISRSADGDTITVEVIGPKLAPIERLFFRTNAAGFSTDGSGTISLGITTFGVTDEPLINMASPSAGTTPVPLPSGLLLLVGALGGLAIRRKK